MEDLGKVNGNVVANRWMPLFCELHERPALIEQVREVVNEMKLSKARGLVGFPEECFK